MRVIATLLVLLAGCGGDDSGVDVEFDDGMREAVLELARSGGSRPLKEVAPGDWTSVQVLLGPASGARIERELGQPAEIDGDGTQGGDYVQDGNLPVFRRDDRIVRMVSLGQPAALAEGRYDGDIVLTAQDGAVTMTEPAGR